MSSSKKIALIYQDDSAHIFEVSKFGYSENRTKRHVFSGTHQDAAKIARRMIAEGCDAKTGRCNIKGDIAYEKWRFGTKFLIASGLPIVTTSGSQNRVTKNNSSRSIPVSDINYDEYMHSPEWDVKRKAAIIVAGNRCQICNAGNRRLDVHHRTYIRLGNEIPQDLIALCRACHKLFHKYRKLARY